MAALSADTHQLKMFDMKMFDNGKRTWETLASGATLHNPLWSRDGKTLYFQDLGASGQPVYRLQIGSHGLQRLGGLNDILHTDSIYSALTGITPDDSPIVLEIHSINDLYALDILLP